jgi:transcription elongation factor S-II
MHVRDRCRQAFARVLRTSNLCDIDMADKLEEIVLNFIKSEYLPTWDDVRSESAYRRMVIRVATAIRSDGYHLLKQILNGELEIEKLPKLTDREIRPLYWQEQDALDLKRKIQENNAMKDLEAISHKSGFSCGRCRAAGRDYNKVLHTEFQTRSADEPVTIFLYCTVCEKRWRQ